MYSAVRPLLFLIALFTSFVASAQNVSYTIANGTAAPGGTAVLNISINSTGGAQPASLQWTIGFSSTDISNISVAAGSAATAASTLPKLAPGRAVSTGLRM